MGPEDFARLMAYNKASGGFAAAFGRDPILPPVLLPTGVGSLNGDLGLRASERGGAGSGTVYPIRDCNLDSDCHQAGMGDVDYRRPAGLQPPLPAITSELYHNILRDVSPLQRRVPSGTARDMRLTDSRSALGSHRSGSPGAPRRSRSPRTPRRSRSPLAPDGRSPHLRRSPFVPHRSRSPLAPHGGRSSLRSHRILSPHPSLSSRWSPRPQSAHRASRRSRSLSPVHRTRSEKSRSRERGGQESRLGSSKRNQLRNSYCIKVCNVPARTLYSAIWARFKPFVTVTYVEMNREDSSALVYLEKLEDREKAFAGADRILEEGMTMIPWEGGSATLPPDPIDPAHPKASRFLLVSHLDKSVSRKDLRNHFQRFGRIVEVEIKRIARAKHYYALLQFFTVKSACEAIKRMDGVDLGGSRVHLSFGVTPESKCICASGLSTDLTSDYILQRFMRFGQVDKVAYNPLSCAALVLFKTTSQASHAVEYVKRNPSEHITVDYADDHFQLWFCRTMKSMGLDSGDFLFM